MPPAPRLSPPPLTRQTLAPGSQVTLEGTRKDGSTYAFPLNHTFNDNQINWFKNGSALNAMAAAFKAGKM